MPSPELKKQQNPGKRSPTLPWVLPGLCAGPVLLRVHPGPGAQPSDPARQRQCPAHQLVPTAGPPPAGLCPHPSFPALCTAGRRAFFPLRVPVCCPGMAPRVPASRFSPPQTVCPVMQLAGRCLLGPIQSRCSGAWSTQRVNHVTEPAHDHMATSWRSQVMGSRTLPGACYTQLKTHLHAGNGQLLRLSA